MDKNTYETYEFLPANSTETDADQFFVVQDDGTFLINRQVQYVAQVQDVKEALEDVQPCTVYDVSSQQFYVDVDNSAELISVSDQFILPEGENGIYNNSYLLQPSSSATVEQMDQDVIVDQYKETNTQDIDIDLVTHNSKQNNNFTEITLSDEQYRTLEQKGWILLEAHNKIFVLNTLGLHDITTNDKLIQKLKNELQSSETGDESGCTKTENIQNQFPNVVQSLANQAETVEFVIGDANEQDEKSVIDNLQFIVDEKDIPQSIIEKQSTEEHQVELVAANNDDNENPPNKNDSQTLTKSLKIKTKLSFKDIPDNILLGKTVNGKKLIAKVTHRQSACKEKAVPKSPSKDVAVVYEDIAEHQHHNVTGLVESEFVSLIQQSVRGRTRDVTTLEDIASADNVVNQLLKMPNMKDSLIDEKLIITKMSNNKDEFGVIHNKSKVKLVTGRVVLKDNDWIFEYVPDLLQNIKTVSDVQNTEHDDEINSIQDESNKNINVFHIHITEIKCSDNIVRVSVTLHKRQLAVNLIFDLKRRYPNTIFACGTCATMYKSEEALKEHQENNCLDTDMLAVDTNSSGVTCSVLKGDKKNIFGCTLCDATFQTLRNCQRHVKTHAGKEQQENETSTVPSKQEESPNKINQVYKCKMCPSMYFHPSTLSKHIVKRHINVK